MHLSIIIDIFDIKKKCMFYILLSMIDIIKNVNVRKSGNVMVFYLNFLIIIVWYNYYTLKKKLKYLFKPITFEDESI